MILVLLFHTVVEISSVSHVADSPNSGINSACLIAVYKIMPVTRHLLSKSKTLYTIKCGASEIMNCGI